MRCSLSIMAHPSRKRMVEELLELIPNTPIAWDEKNNIWDTCKRAWKLHDPKADFHFVIQDDSILCKDFLNELKKLPNEDRIYALYIGNRARFKDRVNEARKNGDKFLINDNIHHEIALGFPTKRIKEMINFCDELNPDTDKVINQYVNNNKLKVYVPLPNLINHRVSESIYGKNKSKFNTRTSIWFKEQ